MSGDWDKFQKEAKKIGFPWGLVLKVAAWFIAFSIVILGVVFVVGTCSGAFGWMKGAAEIASFENVEKQFTIGYGYYEEMQASADKTCPLITAYGRAVERGDENTITQRESQALAQILNFEGIQAKYLAWAENVFEGQIAGPLDDALIADVLSGIGAPINRLPDHGHVPELEDMAPCDVGEFATGG